MPKPTGRALKLPRSAPQVARVRDQWCPTERAVPSFPLTTPQLRHEDRAAGRGGRPAPEPEPELAPLLLAPEPEQSAAAVGAAAVEGGAAAAAGVCEVPSPASAATLHYERAQLEERLHYDVLDMAALLRGTQERRRPWAMAVAQRWAFSMQGGLVFLSCAVSLELHTPSACACKRRVLCGRPRSTAHPPAH